VPAVNTEAANPRRPDAASILPLDNQRVEALSLAVELIFHHEYCPYFELRSLLASDAADSPMRFRKLFSRYYDLYNGGLTEAFLDRYFELLWQYPTLAAKGESTAHLLRTLYEEKRRKGDHSLQFSFVSKLVAIHDESSPIYDKHVVAFVGAKPPNPPADVDRRIHWYEDFIRHVRASYAQWCQEPAVKDVLLRFHEQDPKLSRLHPVRVLDFLVWKVGNAELLPRPQRRSKEPKRM
jgi:hypothetical protein